MYPLFTCGPSYWKLNYIAPVDVVIGSEIEVPEIPERLVWKSLSNITRTATGPDGIPFWVWKEHAEILTPILSHIWNLSLRTHTWPMSWKRSNINPIPKVDLPKEKSDNCGINITPVIARVFKKAVYDTFVKEAVVENLSTTQFAYCASGNCISALLAIQHFINKHLDNPDCEAVRGRVVIEVTERKKFWRWGRPGGYQAHGNRRADVEGARCCPKCHVGAKGHEFEFEMS